MYIWSLVLIVAGSMALPLTGYVAVGVLNAQEAASDDSNPRADYWREVRGGVAGYSAVTGQETDVLIQNGGQNWRQVRNGPVATYGAWVLLAMIGILAIYHLLTGGYKMPDRTGRKILRWPGIDRFIHWYTAVLFIVLAITGLSLLWGRAVLIPVMGKEGFAAWAGLAKPIHDYGALLFTAGFVVMLLKWMHHNIPKAYDLEWFAKGGGYLGGGHPPAGFANAGEKALFWTLVFAGGAMVVSGLFLLFPNWGTERAGMQLANEIHGISSLICVTFVVMHIYLATIGSEGALEGMISGEIDEQYAKNHHPLWYEEVMQGKGQGQVQSAGAAPSPAPAAPEK
jgi:formate dehydrogenase subunit gamma